MPASRDEIMAIIAHEARTDQDRLVPSATLASLEFDSLDVVSVLFSIEDKFGVVIQTEDVAAVQTLGEFVDLIMGRMQTA